MSYDRARDETRFLLHDHRIESQSRAPPPSTPIPLAQFTALCTVRLVEPIAFTQLFPYVNEFIRDLHPTDVPSRVGFYNGLVESGFSIAQLASIYHWTRLSNVVGRRPVILVGILGTAITTFTFGVSDSLVTVFISRCISGLSSGNIAVIHSMLGEITDASNQGVAFPIFGLIWPLGAIIGPLIGGSFSHPSIKYPYFFTGGFWRHYPYFLPCLIAGTISFVGVILGFVFLEESHPSKRKHRGEKSPSVSTRGQHLVPLHVTRHNEPMNLRALLSVPIIWNLVASGFALSFMSTAFDVVFVLFCYSPVRSGGLAFSPEQIGYALAGSGVMLAMTQVFITPHLLRTFDCAKIYNFCMGLWPWSYMAFPMLNIIARNNVNAETGQLDARMTAVLWTGIAIILVLSRIGSLPYSLSLILIKTNVPSAAALGQSNGVVQFAMCSARSLAPFLVSFLFSLSIENQLLGGHLWVLVMVSLAFCSMTISRQICLHGKRTVC